MLRKRDSIGIATELGGSIKLKFIRFILSNSKKMFL